MGPANSHVNKMVSDIGKHHPIHIKCVLSVKHITAKC